VTDIDQLYEQIKLAGEHEKYHRWLFFEPYPKQQEFMNLGATFKERLLIAGNQTGKSDTGGYETSRHLTGIYPPNWKGLRFDQNTGPCPAWVGGTSGIAVRDGAQTKLFGPPGVGELFGTGFIPKEAIIGEPSSSRSATHAIDTAHIRHVSGGISSVSFKTYSQERTDWQGPTKKFIWFDEEAPLEIYTEGLARLAATGGSHILTFTPLFGFSDVVKRFLECPADLAYRRVYVQMALTDARHMTDELVKATLSIYPPHTWAARRDGDPYMSGGLVFTSDPEALKEQCFSLGLGMAGLQIPPEWPRLWGIDLLHAGGDNTMKEGAHAFAAVLLAWDRERDTGHIVDGFKTRDGTIALHALRMRSIAANVPVAWPHDGNIRDFHGEEIVKLYRKHYLNMLGEHATFPSGGYSTEAGVLDLDTAMREGRFFVSERLQDWFQEFRLYHRDEKTGQIVKINDDLMSATRIVWMMRRFGRCVPLGSKFVRPRRDGEAEQVDPHTGRPVQIDLGGFNRSQFASGSR